MNSSRPLFAAVMIVKNEEQHLRRCLSSIRQVCDEIIVVDTGSTDATVSIAEQFGAKIFHRVWQNDFAAARNESLSHTNAEWVLYIDADEVVTNADLFPIRDVLNRAHDVAAFGVQLSPMIGWLPYTDFRIWRHDPQIQFVGEIHETTLPDIRRLADERNQQLIPIPLHIQHLGYEQDQTKKSLRNLPLLLQQLEETPRRINIIGQIGRIQQSLGNHDEAEQVLQKAVDIIREDGEKEITDVVAIVSLAQLLLSRGKDSQSLLVEAEELRPDYLVTHLVAAQNHLTHGRFAEAIKHAEILLEKKDSNPTDSRFAYNQSMFSIWPQHVLADSLFALGDYPQAWLAYGDVVVMGLPYAQVRDKIRECEREIQSTTVVTAPHSAQPTDLSDVTFLIPLRIDSGERLRNVIATTNWLVNTFSTNVIVGVADTENMRAILDPRVLVVSIDDNPTFPFHVTRAFNELFQTVNTPIFVHYDTDVLVPEQQLIEAVSLIRNNSADLVLPYDVWVHVPSDEVDTLVTTNDISYASVGYPRSIGIPTGGCVIRTVTNFIAMGMDNEHFIGWSPEDQERLHRAEALGSRISRIPGSLFHLEHPRQINLPFHDPFWQAGNAEYKRLSTLSTDELLDEKTAWPWCSIRYDKVLKSLEASDLTITIPVRIDTPDRLRNLVICTNFLLSHTNARVLVGIGDPSLVEQFLDSRVEIVQLHDPSHLTFHRTRMLNDLARRVDTDFIANLDCDVVIPLAQWDQSLQLLREHNNDLVYPYDGMMMEVPYAYHPWLERADFGSLPSTLQRVMHPTSLGGCVIWRRSSFMRSGMENEHLISWGYDDDERYARAISLGQKITRVDGCIYHLYHQRGVDSSPTNPFVESNRAEFERISHMSSEDLRAEIGKWSWVSQETGDRTRVLVWNDPWHPMSYFAHPDDSTYVVSRSSQDIYNADIIVVPFPVSTPEDLHYIREQISNSQRLVGFCREALTNTAQSDKMSELCDALMTYETSSEIPLPYVSIDEFRTLPSIIPLSCRHNTLVSAWISSALESSGRTHLLHELMTHIQIDSYGHIAKNCALEDDIGIKSKLETISQYRFTLAFENAIATDYVTEKFFQPLLAGSVPIYLGAPNIEDFVPGDNCYINASDFSSMNELATYLTSLSDDDYAAFHEWRQEPLRQRFIELRSIVSTSPFTRLVQWHLQQGHADVGRLAPSLHQ
jgi:tetratricopeptide (TPR) repeat protein